GHADAQYNLGVMYDNGQGVDKDPAQAVDWYRKAAEQGHTRAQVNLGVMYENGQGVGKDPTQAVDWHLKAAEQGDALAQFNVGVMYDNGQGVDKDPAQAVDWYRKAAEQGHANAQNNLGWMHENGTGIIQDHDTAVHWYRKAAIQGNAWGQRNLGRMHRDGLGVAKNTVYAYAWLNLASAAAEPPPSAITERNELAERMGAAQIKEAQRLSREWRVGQNLGTTKLKEAAVRPTAVSTTKAAQGEDEGWPARPAKRSGVTSCNTRCINDSCMRTYDDGRRVRFRAKQKWNPFSNSFEWDSGSC
ncbi:MAG: sel1 repeat family protein, partial [Aquabacterium sp.]